MTDMPTPISYGEFNADTLRMFYGDQEHEPMARAFASCLRDLAAAQEERAKSDYATRRAVERAERAEAELARVKAERDELRENGDRLLAVANEAARDLEAKLDAVRQPLLARAIKAEQECGAYRKDAKRYRFLREETDRIDPVAAVSWKWKMNRESSEWANTASSKSLDDHVDAAIAAKEKL